MALLTVREYVAVVVAATVSVVLSGCGSQPAPLDPSRVAAVDATTLAIHTRIAGNVDQRKAYEASSFRDREALMAECMAKGGQAYRPALYVDGYNGWTSVPLPAPAQEAASTDTSAGTGFGMAAAVELTRQMRDADLAAGRAPPQTAQYFAVESTCQSEQPSENTAGLPAFTEPLLSVFYQSIYEALKSSGAPGEDAPRPEYEQCLRRKGFAASSQADLRVLVTSRFAPFLATDDRTEQPAVGPQWDAALDFEHAAADADAACRNAAHARYDAVLEPLLAQFEAQHTAELADIDAEWKELVAQAPHL